MKCNFLLLLLSLSIGTMAQGWEKADIPERTRYEDIYFVNDSLGWTVNGSGEIYKSSDGGRSWEKQFESPYYLRSVDFLDKNIGIAASLDSVVYRTTDGGKSWEEIQDNFPSPIAGICGLSHVEGHLFGVGVWFGPATFVHSVDSGKTWTVKEFTNDILALVDCHFLSPSTGFISGESTRGAVILKTEDGGASWEKIFQSDRFAEVVWKLDFLNDTLVFGSIQNTSHLNLGFIKSTDGGNTWERSEIFYEDDFETFALGLFQGIGFKNEQVGIVGFWSDYTLLTQDGGKTWTRLEGLRNVNRVVKFSENNLLVAGATIYYNTGDLPTSHVKGTLEKRKEVFLIQENPVKEELSFQLNIEYPQFAKVDLVSLNGQHVHAFYKGKIGLGTHTFSLESQDLPKGVYLLLLRTHEGVISQKIQIE